MSQFATHVTTFYNLYQSYSCAETYQTISQNLLVFEGIRLTYVKLAIH